MKSIWKKCIKQGMKDNMVYKRILFGIFLSFLVCVDAHAIIDIGQGEDMPPSKESTPKKSEKDNKSKEVEKTVDDTSGSIEAAKEGRGLFSFMNFNFWSSKDKGTEEKDVSNEGILKLIKESEEGVVESQLTLAFIYLYGNDDLQPDYSKALKYYEMAAKLGDKTAINNLGSLYYSGIGTPRDVSKAAELFSQALELGNGEAGLNLAFIYISGMGLPKDYAKAVESFKKSAEIGNPTARFMYGYSLYVGFMEKRDLRNAFIYIKDAADADYDDAQYILARMYKNGQGTTKNYNNMIKYYTLSGEQGNTNAMMELADVLVDGILYPQNLPRAHVLYNIASVRGAAEAGPKRDEVEKRLSIEEVLSAQGSAERFVDYPSEMTVYINNTFGVGIRKYIDDAIKIQK